MAAIYLSAISFSLCLCVLLNSFIQRLIFRNDR